MSILQEQKVDYLWKKVGFGVAKSDVNSKKFLKKISKIQKVKKENLYFTNLFNLYIKIFTKVTNISILVNGFYLSSNCTCYMKIFTNITNISNVTLVENH